MIFLQRNLLSIKCQKKSWQNDVHECIYIYFAFNFISVKRDSMWGHLGQAIKWSYQGQLQTCRIFTISTPHMRRCIKTCCGKIQTCIHFHRKRVFVMYCKPGIEREKELLSSIDHCHCLQWVFEMFIGSAILNIRP